MAIRCTSIISIFLLVFTTGKCEKVLMTEVFAITIEPTMFNWTFQDVLDQYCYQASLHNYPDLPSWMAYTYSVHTHHGYLYGVPPPELQPAHHQPIHHIHGHLLPQPAVHINVVALNRLTYETRRVTIPIEVTSKLAPAKYEVQLKVDNLNVADMLVVSRMDRLKDIFRKRLWRDSQNDLYVTFMAEAVKMGARLPLRPSDGEGVVLRLGSRAPLSAELRELQEEVRPLWKLPACPRDFKRTTVERLFRENGFTLDWCSFRLIEDKSSNEELVNNIRQEIHSDIWKSIAKTHIPQREYTFTVVLFVVPFFSVVILVIILSLLLCFDPDGLDISDMDVLDNPMSNSTLQSPKPVHTTLRSVANCVPAGARYCSTGSTPTTTLGRCVYGAPSPPPYTRPSAQKPF